MRKMTRELLDSDYIRALELLRDEPITVSEVSEKCDITLNVLYPTLRYEIRQQLYDQVFGDINNRRESVKYNGEIFNRLYLVDETYTDYMVSTSGNVLCTRGTKMEISHRPSPPSRPSNTHPVIKLKINGKTIKYRYCDIVALVTLPTPDRHTGCIVTHIDGDIFNNRTSNLTWSILAEGDYYYSHKYDYVNLCIPPDYSNFKLITIDNIDYHRYAHNGVVTNYFISRYGVVISTARGASCPIYKKPTPGKKQGRDYDVMGMDLNNGNKINIPVHIMVATVFYGPKLNDTYQVDHIDCNKLNNCVENLEWVDGAENLRRSRMRAIYNHNETTSYDDDIILEVLRLRQTGLGLANISIRLNIDELFVYGVLRRDIRPDLYNQVFGESDYRTSPEVIRFESTYFYKYITNEGLNTNYYVSRIGEVISNKGWTPKLIRPDDHRGDSIDPPYRLHIDGLDKSLYITSSDLQRRILSLYNIRDIPLMVYLLYFQFV